MKTSSGVQDSQLPYLVKQDIDGGEFAEKSSWDERESEVYEILEAEYKIIDASKGELHEQRQVLGGALFEAVEKLSRLRHAARGVALTLVAYKLAVPTQDIRYHKADQSGGFSARRIDTNVTVKFLQRNSLKYNVETHWLSQTFSFAGPYLRESVLKTSPAAAGHLMLFVLNSLEEGVDKALTAKSILGVLIAGLVEERNKGKVLLEKPKDLSIDQLIRLLELHFFTKYEKNAPRLPQLAIYAIYDCIVGAMNRYEGASLLPLERMKAANRKSGSVGDIDVTFDNRPIEAVEVKFGIPVSLDHVSEAIEKIRTASVERYLILSTAGVLSEDIELIKKIQAEFRRVNGCEIIVNGVLDTIKYYLRLIRSTSQFVIKYTTLVEGDDDLSYEHRLAWNAACSILFAND